MKVKLHSSLFGYFFLLALLVILSRGWIISEPFIIDDYTLLNHFRSDQTISLRTLFDLYVFTRPETNTSWKTWWADADLKLAYCRPLPATILWIEYNTWGRNPAFYHITTLIAYLGCLILLFKLGSLLCNRVTGLIIAALFCVTPSHLTVVQWVANRVDIISSLFLLAGYLFYTYGFLQQPKSMWIWWTWLTYLFAIFSKENAGLFPVTLFLYHLFLCFWLKKDGRSRIEYALRYLIKSVSGLSIITAGWYIFYVKFHYGVRSGYLLPTVTPYGELLKDMLKSFILYLGDILYFIQIKEVMKNKMVNEYLWMTILLVMLSFLLSILLYRLLGRALFPLMGLIVISIIPALPFWINERLCFSGTIWVVILVGVAVYEIRKQIHSPIWRKVLIGAILGWWLIGAGVMSFDRATTRKEWNEEYEQIFFTQLKQMLATKQKVKTVYFLNIPSPVFALSLTDSLRWNLERTDVTAHVLSVQSTVPQVIILNSSKVIVKPAQPYFTTMLESIFLTSKRVWKGKNFSTPEFSAEIYKMFNGQALEVVFTFNQPIIDGSFMFLQWNPDTKQIVPYLF